MADSRDEITKDCHRASSSLATELKAESAEARQAHRECTRMLYRLTAQLGQASAKRVPLTDSAGTPLLDSLAPLRQQLVAATERMRALLARDREELHGLAVQESHRRQSVSSNSSVSMNAIDSMSTSRFINLVEKLLQRDGFQTARLDSAGAELLVSATCPRGHSFLVSPHRVRGPHGWKPEPAEEVSTPSLHAARLVAEHCEPDVFVVVTNGGVSAPARRYAKEHDMCLLSRRDLRRWAEWEEPMECVEEHEQGAA
jgi:hypothetical protein